MSAADEKQERDVGLLQELLKEHFHPAATYSTAHIRFSTQEVYDHLAQLAPLPELKLHVVYLALQRGGYRVVEKGDMEFVWLLRRNGIPD